jgi:iron complex outermembrane receptor protein
MVSPHFALNKVFNKHFSAYFSYSKGYKAPVSSYFYLPFVAAAPTSTGVINQGLKPEIANQFEIGTKGTLHNDRLSYQLAYFDAIFSNKMTAINVLNTAGTSTLYTYVANSGKQNDQGIEGVVKYTAYKSDKGFIASVQPFVNFTYSNFKYKDYSFHYKGKILIDSVVNYDGKAVAGVAKFTGNFGVDVIANNGLYFSTIYSYKDGFPISSDGLNNTTSYSLWNAKLGFKTSLSKHFDIDAFFGINDITNTRYPIMVFINQLPDAYMAGPTKSNYFGGANLKYNF